MSGGVVSFLLRICLVVAFCVWVWRFFEPKSQSTRILRAAFLLLGLLVILAVVRLSSP